MSRLRWVGIAAIATAAAGLWYMAKHSDEGIEGYENMTEHRAPRPALPSADTFVLRVPVPSTALVSASADVPEAVSTAFRKHVEAVLEELPRRADLRQLSPESLHTMPKPLWKAASLLGGIAEKIKAEPGLRPLGARFYAECSGRASLPTTVRASCYTHLKRLSRELRDGRYLSEISSRVDMSVRDLARQLEG